MINLNYDNNQKSPGSDFTCVTHTGGITAGGLFTLCTLWDNRVMGWSFPDHQKHRRGDGLSLQETAHNYAADCKTKLRLRSKAPLLIIPSYDF